MSVRSIAAALLLVLSGCGDGEPSGSPAIEVIDDAGVSVRLDAPAVRIVSLIPGRTDVLLAIGAGDRLIARTRWDDEPSLAGLPSIDNALTPSVEWLVAQRPDLVIAWPDGQSRTIVSRLRELGIPVYGSAVETLLELDSAIVDLGVLTGLTAEATSLRDRIAATLDSVRAAVAGKDPVRVAYLIGTDPPTAAAAGTFIDDLLTVAGGRNIFADAPAKWPQVSLEELVQRAPQVLLVSGERGAAPLDGLRERPGWREVPAVREGHVFPIDAGAVNQPGPSVGETARLFADLLGAAR